MWLQPAWFSSMFSVKPRQLRADTERNDRTFWATRGKRGAMVIKPNGFFSVGKRSFKPNGLFNIKRGFKPNNLFNIHKRSFKPNGLFNVKKSFMKPYILTIFWSGDKKNPDPGQILIIMNLFPMICCCTRTPGWRTSWPCSSRCCRTGWRLATWFPVLPDGFKPIYQSALKGIFFS